MEVLEINFSHIPIDRTIQVYLDLDAKYCKWLLEHDFVLKHNEHLVPGVQSTVIIPNRILLDKLSVDDHIDLVLIKDSEMYKDFGMYNTLKDLTRVKLSTVLKDASIPNVLADMISSYVL